MYSFLTVRQNFRLAKRNTFVNGVSETNFAHLRPLLCDVPVLRHTPRHLDAFLLVLDELLFALAKGRVAALAQLPSPHRCDVLSVSVLRPRILRFGSLTSVG